MAMAALRREVLGKYREILRVANTWKAIEEAQTEAERQYIREEARRLFRKNREVHNHNSKPLPLPYLHKFVLFNSVIG